MARNRHYVEKEKPVSKSHRHSFPNQCFLYQSAIIITPKATKQIPIRAAIILSPFIVDSIKELVYHALRKPLSWTLNFSTRKIKHRHPKTTVFYA